MSATPLLVIRQTANPSLTTILACVLWAGALMLLAFAFLLPFATGIIFYVLVLLAIMEAIAAIYLPTYLKKQLESIRGELYADHILAYLPMGRTTYVPYDEVLGIHMNQNQDQVRRHQASFIFDLPYAPIPRRPEPRLIYNNVSLDEVSIEAIKAIIHRDKTPQ